MVLSYTLKLYIGVHYSVGPIGRTIHDFSLVSGITMSTCIQVSGFGTPG